MSQYETEVDSSGLINPADSPNEQNWFGITAIAISTFTIVTSEILPVGVLTNIAEHYQISDGTVGWMMTAPAVTAALSALVLSVLVGRIDRRWIFLLLSGLMLLANIVIAFAPAFSWVIVARVVSGICVGGTWTFAFAAARRMASEADGGKAVAWVLAGVSAGAVFGVPTGAILSSVIGWQWAFAALALLAGVALLLQWIFLPRLPAQQSLSFTHLLNLLGQVNPRAVLIFLALAVTAHFTGYTYLKPLLVKLPTISGEVISSLLLAYGVTGFVGNFMGERLAAKNLKMALLLGVGLLLLVTVILGALTAQSILLISGLVLLWGIAYGILPVTIQLWMYRVVAPTMVEGSSALVVMAFQLSIALGAWFGGVVVDELGINSVMLTGAMLAVIALLWLLFSRGAKQGLRVD